MKNGLDKGLCSGNSIKSEQRDWEQLGCPRALQESGKFRGCFPKQRLQMKLNTNVRIRKSGCPGEFLYATEGWKTGDSGHLVECVLAWHRNSGQCFYVKAYCFPVN